MLSMEEAFKGLTYKSVSSTFATQASNELLERFI